MSEKVKCAGEKWPDGSYRPYPCAKTGTLEHGGKHWCKTHHPPTVEAKRVAKEEAYQAEFSARMAESKARAAEAAALAADAARFRWLVDHSPSDLGEASDIRAAFDRVMAREGGGK
jgi:hypothetical protein